MWCHGVTLKGIVILTQTCFDMVHISKNIHILDENASCYPCYIVKYLYNNIYACQCI